MKKFNIFLACLFVVGAGFIFFNSPKTSPQTTTLPKPTQQESTVSAQTVLGYQGKALAGTTSPFLEFTKADYEKALAENKVILLDFYANWCPTCKAEEPSIFEGFNLLTSNQVVGFRVNFKDSDTDKDEEEMAKEFKIPYQHTKVIIKNGKEFSRSVESWDKTKFKEELSNALN